MICLYPRSELLNDRFFVSPSMLSELILGVVGCLLSVKQPTPDIKSNRCEVKCCEAEMQSLPYGNGIEQVD